jgi:hypothetical protein
VGGRDIEDRCEGKGRGGIVVGRKLGRLGCNSIRAHARTLASVTKVHTSIFKLLYI